MNPHNPNTERKLWLRWQISDELAASIAPGLGTGSEGARSVLVEWLTEARERLVSHCWGAMHVHARHAGIEKFTREEVAHEIDLVAWCFGVESAVSSDEPVVSCSLLKLSAADVDRALVILNGLIAAGHVVISGDDVIGNASDGETVSLGHVPSYPPAATKFGREALYRYLLANSTPDTW